MTDEQPDLREFPSLDRWGDELREATERAEQRTGRRRVPVRRLALAVAVMLLVVPGAIATRSIWMDPVDRVDPRRDPARPPVVLLAEGRSAGVGWRLGASDRDGARCVQLETLADGDELSGCSVVPASRAQIVIATGESGDVGFVFGTVAADVAEVVVTASGGRRSRVKTLMPDPDTLRRGGMSALRAYIAVFEGRIITPPLVIALDDHGHEIGRRGGVGGR